MVCGAGGAIGIGLGMLESLEYFSKIMRKVQRSGNCMAALSSLTGVSPPASSALPCNPRPRFLFLIILENCSSRGRAAVENAVVPEYGIGCRGIPVLRAAGNRVWNVSGGKSLQADAGGGAAVGVDAYYSYISLLYLEGQTLYFRNIKI